MTRINIGDLFEITTPKGKAYIHYVYKSEQTGELIRVLEGLYEDIPSDVENLETKFFVHFPLKRANKLKVVKKVGFIEVATFQKPKYMRTIHNVRGEFRGWHIVNTDNWKRELVEKLDKELINLSPWGIWNDTLLIERLSEDWSLEKWV